MPSNPRRQFWVGETVHLRVRVNLPGTKRPVDPDHVRLTAVNRDGTPLEIDVEDFVREDTGEYSLVLLTAGLPEGVYDLAVTVDSGPTAVVLLPDRFILKAA